MNIYEYTVFLMLETWCQAFFKLGYDAGTALLVLRNDILGGTKKPN
jgi:hypothetical protein